MYLQKPKKIKLREKGWFFWKQRWYSICSAHLEYDDTCPRCKVGYWHYTWGVAVSGFFHDHFWKLWFYWQNGEFPHGTYEDYTDMPKKK